MSRRRKAALSVLATIVVVLAVIVGSTLRRTDGTWLFHSAPTPEGWPGPTPVGVVQVREYPAYRAATVGAAQVGADSRPMFLTLFRHIKTNDIAMTAPVEMTYVDDGGELASMGFLYRSTTQGAAGPGGDVQVRDLTPRLLASVGVRGAYDDHDTFLRGWSQLETCLAVSDEWVADGPPRFLGYNGPFVPPFFRYGEVQVPVRKRAETELAAY
ncbi:MAG: heme-binding protein [Acidobacteriota bacterium]